MKRYIILFLLLAGAYVSNAQSEEALKKIQAAKIALITERLDLTPEQAQQFWPIYNEYFDKARDLRREYDIQKQAIDPEKSSEEDYKKLLALGQKVKENQINMEREYSDRLLRVISSRQLVMLRKAEDDFKQMLLDRLKNRHERQQRMDQNRQQIRDRNNKRNNN